LIFGRKNHDIYRLIDS